MRSLASLAEQGIISQKMYGKTSIYFARQDQLPAPSSEELGVLDREIAALTAKLAAQREATKEAQSSTARKIGRFASLGAGRPLAQTCRQQR